MLLSVSFKTKAITIDGEMYECEKLEAPPGVYAIRWDDGAQVRGYIWKKGDSHGFKDHGEVEKYVSLWEEAKALHEVKQQQVAATEAREVEKLRSYNDAIHSLTTSDHEVLKAAENMLLANPATSGDVKTLITERRSARAIAKEQKTILKI